MLCFGRWWVACGWSVPCWGSGLGSLICSFQLRVSRSCSNPSHSLGSFVLTGFAWDPWVLRRRFSGHLVHQPCGMRAVPAIGKRRRRFLGESRYAGVAILFAISRSASTIVVAVLASLIIRDVNGWVAMREQAPLSSCPSTVSTLRH